jgi:hypothetical protein
VTRSCRVQFLKDPMIEFCRFWAREVGPVEDCGHCHRRFGFIGTRDCVCALSNCQGFDANRDHRQVGCEDLSNSAYRQRTRCDLSCAGDFLPFGNSRLQGLGLFASVSLSQTQGHSSRRVSAVTVGELSGAERLDKLDHKWRIWHHFTTTTGPLPN